MIARVGRVRAIALLVLSLLAAYLLYADQYSATISIPRELDAEITSSLGKLPLASISTFRIIFEGNARIERTNFFTTIKYSSFSSSSLESVIKRTLDILMSETDQQIALKEKLFEAGSKNLMLRNELQSWLSEINITKKILRNHIQEQLIQKSSPDREHLSKIQLEIQKLKHYRNEIKVTTSSESSKNENQIYLLAVVFLTISALIFIPNCAYKARR
jgi:hypothetical protein